MQKILIAGGDKRYVPSGKIYKHLSYINELGQVNFFNISKIVCISNHCGHPLMLAVKKRGKKYNIPMEFLEYDDFKKLYMSPVK